MNSDNQLWWIFLVILVAVISFIFLQKRRSARPSEEEEKEEVFEAMRDRVSMLENCRTLHELDVNWEPISNWISSNGMSPERDFGLTIERRAELFREVHRREVEDRIRKTANHLNTSLSAFADAVAKGKGVNHNALDVGATQELLAALSAWQKAKLEE